MTVEFRRWRLSGYGAWPWRMAMAYSYDLWLWPRAMAYSEESVQQSQRYRRVGACAYRGSMGGYSRRYSRQSSCILEACFR